MLEQQPCSTNKKLSARRKRWVLLCLRLTISILLCYWAFSKANIAEFGRSLAGVNAAMLAGAFGIWLGSMLLGALRWYLLVRHRAKNRVSYIGVTHDLFLGLFAGLLLPTQVGGDVARVTTLSRRGIQAGEAGASVLVDRMIGIVGLLIMCLGGLLTGTRPSTRYAVLWGMGLVTGIVGLIVLMLLWRPLAKISNRFLHQLRVPRLREAIANMYHSCRSYLLSAWLLGICLVLTLLFHSLVVIANWIAAHALGIDVSIRAAFTLIPSILLLTMVAPFAINGIGIRENLFIWGFSTIGVAPDSALALSTVNLLATFVIALPGCGSVLRLGWQGTRDKQGVEDES